MKQIILLIVLSATGCGTDDSKPSALKVVPVCCIDLPPPPGGSITMCKIVDEETRSVVDVKADAHGMIDTLEDMDFASCQ